MLSITSARAIFAEIFGGPHLLGRGGMYGESVELPDGGRDRAHHVGLGTREMLQALGIDNPGHHQHLARFGFAGIVTIQTSAAISWANGIHGLSAWVNDIAEVQALGAELRAREARSEALALRREKSNRFKLAAFKAQFRKLAAAEGWTWRAEWRTRDIVVDVYLGKGPASRGGVIRSNIMSEAKVSHKTPNDRLYGPRRARSMIKEHIDEKGSKATRAFWRARAAGHDLPDPGPGWER